MDRQTDRRQTDQVRGTTEASRSRRDLPRERDVFYSCGARGGSRLASAPRPGVGSRMVCNHPCRLMASEVCAAFFFKKKKKKKKKKKERKKKTRRKKERKKKKKKKMMKKKRKKRKRRRRRRKKKKKNN